MEVELVQVVLCATIAWAVLIGSVVVYRLCFHPLAGFPGPKSWAISYVNLWLRTLLDGTKAKASHWLRTPFSYYRGF